jgi:hypothetical protein
MDETPRTSGRHSTDDPRGTAYDLIRQHTGTVWVKPDHHRHAQPESFAGDLSVDTTPAVA